MDKYIGRLLDNRYEILEVLGTGGMAVVYKARCHRLNRLVAIKILKDDYMEDEEFRRRFHSESQAVAMLSHPNIVSVYDVSSSVSADYIVMELIDGITLKQYMEKKGVLNWKETLHFAIQIGKALEHAHSRGIVHRDIKPHNVMVLKNGSVKVTDFGIARMMSQGNTLTKEALGSVHYISPEQAKGGRVDNRSDIYSLGVVMYEMMSGRPPYDGESPVAVAIQHINGGAPLPSTLNPNIPGGLEQIIMHAMSMEPAMRYATATMMLADMDEFRKNPAILFDYNIPGMEELLKPQKPPLVLEPEPPKAAADPEEEKQNGDMPPLIIPPKRRAGGQVSGKQGAAATSPKKRTTAAAAAAARKNRTPGKSNKNREGDRANTVATVAIIACAAVMILAIAIFLFVLLSNGFSEKPEYVEVPNLLGMDYESIKDRTDLGVEIKLNSKLYSAEYPEGQIMDQNPVPGGQVVKGAVIAVDVSLGKEKEPIVMPDILGFEQSEAERVLDNLGIKLEIEIQKENHDEIEAGKVIRTEPVAKEQLVENQKIAVVVSLGPKTASMPDLAGSTEEEARAKLNELQLNLEIEFKPEETYNPEVEADRVVRTDPEPGKDVSANQKVIIYMNQVPEMNTIPNVIGAQEEVAKSGLETYGFKTYKTEMVPNMNKKGTVIELCVNGMTVQPGDKIATGAEITIRVSSGPVTKEVEITVPAEFVPPYDLVIKQEDEVVLEIKQISESKVTVTLEGVGKEIYDVYIGDTKLPDQLEVDFTK